MKMKNGWEKGVDLIVDSLGYATVRFAPVIAPIPSIAVILEVSNYSAFAWFTVVTIEMVGYAIGDKMVEAVRRKVLPMRQAMIPLIVYAIIIEGLMLGYKVIPAWTGDFLWADAIRSSVPMLYPFFTLAGAGLYAFHEYLKEIQIDTQYEKDTARADQELDTQSDRELKRQRQQVDLDAYKAKLTQDVELDRERALAGLRIKEKKAAVKLSDKDTKNLSTGGELSGGNFPESVEKVSGESLGKKLVMYYKANPGAKFEDAAMHVGWSVPAVSKEISTLVGIGVFDAVKEGRRKVVTVNGRHEEYLAT